MAYADFQLKQQQNKQKGTIREYFAKRNGQLLVLSDDPTFISLLRATIKDIALNQPEMMVVIPDVSRTLKSIMDSFAANRKPALFIERILGNTGDTSFLVKQFRESFPELRIFVMTTSADKGRIMLLYESGADNFILKPISSIDLIEKMSVTLRQPSVIRQLLDKARTFVVKTVGGEALKITRKVLEVKPDSASGYVVMGDALRITGNNEKAQAAYERASKFSNNYMEPLQKMVELAKETNQPQMQLEYLRKLDEISPLNAQRKVEMGELEIALGNPKAATFLFDTAVNRAYKDAMAQVAAMTEKIAISLQDIDPVQAERYLRKCLELKGRDLTADDLSTFNQLGISLRKQGRWEDAITEYKKALKIAPNEAVLYYNIGMAHAEGKNYEAAIGSMLKALSFNASIPRTSAAVAYNMGKVFSFGYTKEKARQCLEIALDLQPEYPIARELLDRVTAELSQNQDIAETEDHEQQQPDQESQA